jgi:hypothetical protein
VIIHFLKQLVDGVGKRSSSTQSYYPSSRVKWIVFGAMMTKEAAELKHSLRKLPRPNTNDMDFLLRLFYTNSPEWILRTLTTKELVRRSVLAREHEINGTPITYGAGLGGVLLSRIGWSSEPSTDAYSSSIYRGIWAGHKFDATLMEALEGEDGWKKVSESAYEELKGIWQSYYVVDWEKNWLSKHRVPSACGKLQGLGSGE